jgi:hypothetical protein
VGGGGLPWYGIHIPRYIFICLCDQQVLTHPSLVQITQEQELNITKYSTLGV